MSSASGEGGEEGQTVPTREPSEEGQTVPTKSLSEEEKEEGEEAPAERKYNPLRRTGDSKKRAYQSFVVPQRTSQFIARLPKVELHVHLPGAFDLEVSGLTCLCGYVVGFTDILL